jgi:hypothetical protein
MKWTKKELDFFDAKKNEEWAKSAVSGFNKWPFVARKPQHLHHFVA